MAPDDVVANEMRAVVLSGVTAGAWEVGPRSAAELREAATHFERAAALTAAPAVKASRAAKAAWCTDAACLAELECKLKMISFFFFCRALFLPHCVAYVPCLLPP